jgi:cytochrome b involved in lipid metabolism
MSEFRISKEVAQQEREAHGERKKVRPAGGERSSMHAWMMQTMKSVSSAQLQKFGGAARPRAFTPDEISAHNSEGDNWMVIRGVVYDVSKFAEFHPGGTDIMTKYAGKDVTDLYDVFHPWVNAEAMLSSCMVGVLAASS